MQRNEGYALLSMDTSSSLVNKKRRHIGQFEVGPLAYGLWRFTDANVSAGQKRIETAVEHGLNLIDVADVYGFDWGGSGFGSVEIQLGRVFAQSPELRSQVVLATKGGIIPPRPYDSSKKYLTQACEDSLKRLNTDVIDIYQIHRHDMYTHPEEVADTLSTLREAGKIKEVGVSNYTPQQVTALATYLPFPIICQQPEFSLLHLTPLRDGILDQCLAHKITPLAWSPLAGGRIPLGKADVPQELIKTLDRLATREGVDRAAIALAFVLAHPSAPICLIGTQNSARIAESTKALDVYLSRDDVYRLIQDAEGIPLP